MSILIGADIVPTQSNFDLFRNGDVRELIGPKLMDELHKADYRIFNLEVPLTNTATPIAKWGPNLIAPCDTVKGFQALSVNLLGLANNHILDQDVQGLFSTKETLRKAGIAFVGAGNTPAEAARPYIFTANGKKVGVYACAEHEFSIVSVANRGGANPFDPLESPDHVAALKQQCDYVIVLYHGGKEHYRYSSPNLQRICRKLVDKGADLVVCQHTHCIGCEEKYQGGTIVYGQGNFLFDSENNENNECWKTGLLIQVNNDFSVEYLPLVKMKSVVRLANEADAEQILRQFGERSEEIKTEGTIEKKYEEFAESMLKSYFSTFFGHQDVCFRALNKLTKNHLRSLMIERRFNERQKMAMRNFIECEAHRELLLCGLKRK